MRKYEDGESNREEGDAVANDFHDACEVHLGKGIWLLELWKNIAVTLIVSFYHILRRLKNYEYKQKAANRF